MKIQRRAKRVLTKIDKVADARYKVDLFEVYPLWKGRGEAVQALGEGRMFSWAKWRPVFWSYHDIEWAWENHEILIDYVKHGYRTDPYADSEPLSYTWSDIMSRHYGL